jgi:hypothetical protein
MSQLSAIAYTSTSVHPMSRVDIEALLFKCRAFNSAVGVTGALLLSDRTFFQYFEGPPEGVGQAYKRIIESARHTKICELFNEAIEKRLFSQWQMGFAEVPDSLVLLLEQAQWRRDVGALTTTKDRAPGLDLLLEFWGKANVQVR